MSPISFTLLPLITFLALTQALPTTCITIPTGTAKIITSTITFTAAATPTFPAVTNVNNSTIQNSGVGTCSKNHKISCCNQKQSESNTNVGLGDLTGGTLGGVLGGSCAVSSVTGGICRGGNTYCCPTDQKGEINVAMPCSPLLLKLR